MTTNILIIGCRGQDGSYMTKSLIRQGFNVIGTSRFEKPEVTAHKKIGITQSLKIKKLNLTHIKETANLIEKYAPSEIYNFSAQSSVGLSFTKPVETLNSIVDSTRTLLEAARIIKFPGRIFFAGSSEIYGETKTGIKIKDKQNPKNPYGLAKQQSLGLVDLYREVYGIKCITGILFNHESPIRPTKFVTSKIINGAIKSLKDKNYKLHLGNGSIRRDWGWAEEYVDAMQLILRAPLLKNQIVCTGVSTSIKEFVEKSFSKLNLDYTKFVEFKKDLVRPMEIQESFGDPFPIEKDLGWKANTIIDEVIEKLLKAKLESI